MTDLKVIEQQGLRVLTTAQLAECYETTERRISENFNANKERYEEGKHYIVLEGEEKRDFLNRTEIPYGSRAAKFYLWTERGALLHAKSLNTDKAWEVYDQLVETYFRAKKAETALQNLSPQLQFMIRIETEQNEMRKDLDGAIQRIEELERSKPMQKGKLVPTTVAPKAWSERESDYLRKAYSLGQTDVEIAAELGRTVSSIHNKRRILGLCGNRGSKWSTDEDKKLVKLYKKGLTYNEIAKLVGRSYDGVHNRLYLLRRKGKV